MYDIDATPNRAILRVDAEYGKYQILVKELFSGWSRKYSYYVMRGNWVEAGFDNSPDCISPARQTLPAKPQN